MCFLFFLFIDLFFSVCQAFTETHKKRLVSWKQQVLSLLRLFPRKAMPDMSAYRQKGWACLPPLTFELRLKQHRCQTNLMYPSPLTHPFCFRFHFFPLLIKIITVIQMKYCFSSRQTPSAVMFRFLIFVLFFFFLCCFSWNYGSNSLPTAGSVSGGVSRRGQRQFQMTPRVPPTGRMCLPGGIGGASPRHTLTNPALAGQGRQVSIPSVDKFDIC